MFNRINFLRQTYLIGRDNFIADVIELGRYTIFLSEVKSEIWKKLWNEILMFGVIKLLMWRKKSGGKELSW